MLEMTFVKKEKSSCTFPLHGGIWVVQSYTFLTLALVGGKSTLRPGRYTPG